MEKQYRFKVNGVEQLAGADKSLLRYLRDDLHIHSVKDGCSEGACGACTIVADGVAVRACVLTTRLADGRSIVTVEGLSDQEKEAFVYAFGAKGAVQCGFCTPGMVMSAKALLDKNRAPSEDDIKAALRGNVCRCTGYKKIIEAVQLTAAILRGEEKIDYSLEEGASLRWYSPWLASRSSSATFSSPSARPNCRFYFLRSASCCSWLPACSFCRAFLS